jgi:REP element-mobilizing transposase RayT
LTLLPKIGYRQFMARPLRIEFPGAWYHVMNRGRRRERVFKDHSDFQTFAGLLKSTSEMFRAGVAAYCLMPNHYHLLIHTPEGNLTRCMRHIGGVYTQLFNKKGSPIKGPGQEEIPLPCKVEFSLPGYGVCESPDFPSAAP